VVGERMVRVGDTNFRISAIAGFAGQLERDDARDVGLQREHLKIEHQFRVVRVCGRYADRTVEIGQRTVERLRLRLLNPAFHFADAVEILADFGAIVGAAASIWVESVQACR